VLKEASLRFLEKKSIFGEGRKFLEKVCEKVYQKAS
jgi:hypothetical protein